MQKLADKNENLNKLLKENQQSIWDEAKKEIAVVKADADKKNVSVKAYEMIMSYQGKKLEEKDKKLEEMKKYMEIEIKNRTKNLVNQEIARVTRSHKRKIENLEKKWKTIKDRCYLLIVGACMYSVVITAYVILDF
ncbi:MAG: hypothetical protein R3Y24_11805 [Eubacteriales bacterium]